MRLATGVTIEGKRARWKPGPDGRLGVTLWAISVGALAAAPFLAGQLRGGFGLSNDSGSVVIVAGGSGIAYVKASLFPPTTECGVRLSATRVPPGFAVAFAPEDSSISLGGFGGAVSSSGPVTIAVAPEVPPGKYFVTVAGEGSDGCSGAEETVIQVEVIRALLGELTLGDSVAVSGPGDAAIAGLTKRNITFVPNFDDNAVSLFRLDGGLIVPAGQQPSGKSPRAVVALRDGTIAAGIDSDSHTITTYSVSNGLNRLFETSSGGFVPFDLASIGSDTVVVANRDSSTLSAFGIGEDGSIQLLQTAPTGLAPQVVAAGTDGTIAVGYRDGNVVDFYSLESNNVLSLTGSLTLPPRTRMAAAAFGGLEERRFFLALANVPRSVAPEQVCYYDRFENRWVFGKCAAAGIFIGDVEATRTSVFVVTVEPQLFDTLTVYDASLAVWKGVRLPPGGPGQPGLNQLAVAPGSESGQIRVVVTGYNADRVWAFTYTEPPCPVSLERSVVTLGAPGAVASHATIGITSYQPGCDVKLSSDRPWVSPFIARDTRHVELSVEANSGQARSAKISVGDQTLRVMQGASGSIPMKLLARSTDGNSLPVVIKAQYGGFPLFSGTVVADALLTPPLHANVFLTWPQTVTADGRVYSFLRSESPEGTTTSLDSVVQAAQETTITGLYEALPKVVLTFECVDQAQTPLPCELRLGSDPALRKAPLTIETLPGEPFEVTAPYTIVRSDGRSCRFQRWKTGFGILTVGEGNPNPSLAGNRFHSEVNVAVFGWCP